MASGTLSFVALVVELYLTCFIIERTKYGGLVCSSSADVACVTD